MQLSADRAQHNNFPISDSLSDAFSIAILAHVNINFDVGWYINGGAEPVTARPRP